MPSQKLRPVQKSAPGLYVSFMYFITVSLYMVVTIIYSDLYKFDCCYSHCLCGFHIRSLFWFAVLCVFSSFVIISVRKRELVALLLLCSKCHVSVIVLWLFLLVPRVGMWYVIVAFPGHTHLLFDDIVYLMQHIFITRICKLTSQWPSILLV